MKVYQTTNVYEEALKRIDMIFDDFNGNVVISFSGGKDSTVILELSLIIVRQRIERGLLSEDYKLRVFFLDQESEWTKTVLYCRDVFNRVEIDPYWYQFNFLLASSASMSENFLNCWEEGKEWLRDKEFNSIWNLPEYLLPYNRFVDLMILCGQDIFKDLNGKFAVIVGYKSNESLARKMTLTTKCVYRDITWSFTACHNDTKKIYGREMEGYRFAPIWDWQDDDVWTAIGKNGWKYNDVYNDFFRLGQHPRKMRVSSLIHQTSAEHSLIALQEIDPELYDKMSSRMMGVSTYSKLMENIRVHQLPSAFSSWKEFALYLIENLLVGEKNKEIILRNFSSKLYLEYPYKDEFDKEICNRILANDFTGCKLGNIMVRLKKNHNISKGIYDEKYTIAVEGDK